MIQFRTSQRTATACLRLRARALRASVVVFVKYSRHGLGESGSALGESSVLALSS